MLRAASQLDSTILTGRKELKEAIVRLKSVSQYSQSKAYTQDQVPKINQGKENDSDYRKRTWRNHCHSTPTGKVFIPPMALKNCLSEAAKFRPRQIPGKGKSTYTKHFEAGVLVLEGIELPIAVDEVQSEWLFLPADGQRGSGKRVWKCYPLIPNWEGMVAFQILDETITKDVFAETLEEAGKFIGIGRFRPRQNGYYGRFAVEDLDWQDA